MLSPCPLVGFGWRQAFAAGLPCGRSASMSAFGAAAWSLVSIAPGAIEKPHHHCLPAVFVVDRLVSVRDFNGATGEEIPLPIPKDAPLPITAKFLPQPLHLAVRGSVGRASIAVGSIWRGSPSRRGMADICAFLSKTESRTRGSVKANKYRRFSASNPSERSGNSSAKTAQL
jgi:hypothetical protein